MLGRASIVLLHWYIVLHGRRRAAISGVSVGHVSRPGHGGGLVRLGYVVVSTGIGGHVVVSIHGLADMLVVMVVVGWRIVLLWPAAPTRTGTAGGNWPHVGAPLCLLPSRQMPAVVHHAGLGCVLVLR